MEIKTSSKIKQLEITKNIWKYLYKHPYVKNIFCLPLKLFNDVINYINWEELCEYYNVKYWSMTHKGKKEQAKIFLNQIQKSIDLEENNIKGEEAIENDYT